MKNDVDKSIRMRLLNLAHYDDKSIRMRLLNLAHYEK